MLSPTRELAVQIQKVLMILGDFMKVQVHACIGGLSIGDDIKKLEHGVHIVSGTPGLIFVICISESVHIISLTILCSNLGRVFDMIKRRSLRTRNIKMLVLDEADEMLSKGFKEQVCAILD